MEKKELIQMSQIQILVLITLLVYAIFCQTYNLIVLFDMTILAIGFCFGFWIGDNYEFGQNDHQDDDM